MLPLNTYKPMINAKRSARPAFQCLRPKLLREWRAMGEVSLRSCSVSPSLGARAVQMAKRPMTVKGKDGGDVRSRRHRGEPSTVLLYWSYK
jgi:hypothetical protein